MTIAVGFCCRDGIVLAADTKESYGQDDHTYVDKLSLLSQTEVGNRCQGGLVGAGEGYLVDYIIPRIKAMVARGKYMSGGESAWTIESFTLALEKLMAEIYASKAIKAYPHSSATDLYCSILIAIQFNLERPALFVVNSSLVTQVKNEAKIIGYGPMQEMATEMHRLYLTAEEASTAALYLIYDAKRRYGAAGGVVHILKLSGGSRQDFERTWDQPAKESLFNDLRLLHYRMVVTVATRGIAPAEYSRIMGLLVKRARGIKSAFEKIEKAYQEWLLRIWGGRQKNFNSLPQVVQDAIRARQSAPQKSKDQR